MARGVKDGTVGHNAHIGFLHVCTPGTREQALAAYREGFASARPKHKVAKEAEPAEEITEDDTEELPERPVAVVMPTPVRGPSAVSWVCEIEANSRVFTGVGVTHDEALDSARATCGSHFTASYCTKADCKQSM